MKRTQAAQEEGTNQERIHAPKVQDGSLLRLNAQHVGTTRLTQKQDWKQLGPFAVVRWISSYADELELPASTQIHRVQPVSLLDPVANDPLVRQLVSPAPLVEVDGDIKYQVLNVDDSWLSRNHVQYHICWTGYNSLTWDPAKFVDYLQVVEEYHKQYPTKLRPLEVFRGPLS